jgi:hypothetical protein
MTIGIGQTMSAPFRLFSQRESARKISCLIPLSPLKSLGSDKRIQRNPRKANLHKRGLRGERRRAQENQKRLATGPPKGQTDSIHMQRALEFVDGADRSRHCKKHVQWDRHAPMMPFRRRWRGGLVAGP